MDYSQKQYFEYYVPDYSKQIQTYYMLLLKLKSFQCNSVKMLK